MDSSYKGSLWSAILTLIVGIVMVSFSNITLRTIVLIVGLLFIATAVFNLAYEFSGKRAASKTSSTPAIITSIGAGVLGIVMVLMPIGMVNIIIYLFAAAIILLGLFEICSLAFMYRPVTFPFWFFILPSLMVVCGLVICVMGADKIAEATIIVTGIALIVYSVSTFMNIIGLITFRRSIRRKEEAAKAPEATEPKVISEPETTVEATEVKPE